MSEHKIVVAHDLALKLQRVDSHAAFRLKQRDDNAGARLPELAKGPGRPGALG